MPLVSLRLLRGARCCAKSVEARVRVRCRRYKLQPRRRARVIVLKAARRLVLPRPGYRPCSLQSVIVGVPRKVQKSACGAAMRYYLVECSFALRIFFTPLCRFAYGHAIAAPIKRRGFTFRPRRYYITEV